MFQYLSIIIVVIYKARSHGLKVRVENLKPKGRRFNLDWMDCEANKLYSKQLKLAKRGMEQNVKNSCKITNGAFN